MPRRILAINLKFLGDLLIATPVFRSLRVAYPDAHLAVLVRKGYEDALAGNPDVTEVIAFDRTRARGERGWSRLQRELGMLRRLREGRFDTVYCMHPGDRPCVWAWASGARSRVGTSRQPLGFLLNWRSPIPPPRIEGRDYLDYYYALAGRLELARQNRRTVYVVPEDARRAAQAAHADLFADPTVRIVGFHPGTSAPARQWPVERMAEVADRLAASLGTRAVVFAGPKDAVAADELFRRVRVAQKTRVQTASMGQFAACLSRCALLVCNDSGPRHLAAALGVRTVTIMGQKDPRVWGIYTEEQGHWIARRDVDCQPCERIECADPRCMTAVSVEDVTGLAIKAMAFGR